jgi:hypothetical protein
MGIIKEANRREILLERLKSRLNLNGFADSPIAVLAEVIGTEIESVENEIYDFFYRNNISSASEEDLDDIASGDYDTNRLGATRGNSDYFYFFTESGQTFGDINNGSEIIIPVGTLLGVSSPIENSSIIYTVAEEITLRADLTTVRFYAESNSTGTGQNVTEDSIRYHNFLNYTLAEEGILKVTNTQAITNGSDRESDESLRIRSVGRNQRQMERNKNYIFLSLLEESSVFDFEIIESYYGIGTVGVIVKGAGNNTISEETLIRLQDLVATEAKHLGQKIIFSAGLKVKLTIDISCTSTRSYLTPDELTELENEIKIFVYENIKSQEFRKAISFVSLKNDIKTNFQVIEDLGKSSIFESLNKQVEDVEEGAPEEILLSESETLFINKDEYIENIEVSISILGGIS